MSDTTDRLLPFEVDATVVARLADLAPDPMVAHADGVVIWANEAAATMLGYDGPAEMVGQPVLEFVAPESRAVVADRVRRMLVDGDREPLVPEVFLRRDGGRVEVEVSASPIGDVVLVVGRDVTRRNQAERERLAAATRFHVFFDAAGEPMCIAHGGAILEANPAFAALVGCERVDEVRGHALLSYLAFEDRAEIAPFVEDPAGPIETTSPAFVRITRPDGEERVTQLRLTAYVEESERYVAALLRDVTDERAAEERRKQRERLEAIGRLAAGVAHDFNNILAGMVGYAELALYDAEPGTPLHDSQLHIRDAALRARDLVHQILTFGRQRRPDPRPVDLAAVAREAIALVRPSLPEGVTLDADLGDREVVTMADPTELHQVVMNLLTNARDALSEVHGGTVRVRTEDGAWPTGASRAESDPWICLTVADDGPGMDEHTRTHLFEPYMTTKRRRGGHGLGLAVVDGIVSTLDGVIEVDSTLGQGTAFRIYLPQARGASVATGSAGPAARESHGERILLVDDDPTTLLIHARLLTSLGYVVESFADPRLALRRIEDEAAAPYDLVITDQGMEALSGTALAARVSARRPGTPVLLCSGLGDELELAPDERAVITGQLQKPLTRELLARAVQSALTPGS